MKIIDKIETNPVVNFYKLKTTALLVIFNGESIKAHLVKNGYAYDRQKNAWKKKVPPGPFMYKKISSEVTFLESLSVMAKQGTAMVSVLQKV